MLRFEWNSLRIGHRVLVHDRDAPGAAPLAGVVAMVDEARGDNDVGIRTTEVDGSTRVRRPSRLGVELG